jgi:hypothetical protein
MLKFLQTDKQTDRRTGQKLYAPDLSIRGHKNALRKKELQNRNTKEAPIDIGMGVLLRNRVLGRNKFQDTWSSTPYKVVARLGKNVYTIQLADGTGPTRNVTRTELLDTGSKINDEMESDSSDDSDVIVDQLVDITPQQEAHALGDMDLPDGTDIQSEDEPYGEAVQSAPRRSTKGKHSNPFHLPTSAVVSNKEMRVSPSKTKDFSQLSDAIASLGASLGASLSATLSQSWANEHIFKQ